MTEEEEKIVDISGSKLLSVVNCAEMFENCQIDMVVIKNTPWFKGKDIAKILGYDNTTKSIRDNVDKEDKRSLSDIIYQYNISNKKYNQNQLKTIYINKVGLITLLTYSKQPNKSDFIRWCKDKFNINYQIITRLYKEQETVGQLIKVFDYKEYKLQYSIGTYRIDLYFPNEKLAIECDEYGHKDRNSEYEKDRELFIKNELKCNFIRYNPDDPNFCIFKLIQKIVKFFSN